MLLNCVLEKTLESPLACKEIQPVHHKGNKYWMFIGRTDAEAVSNTLATWCKELTHLKKPWCWERLRAGGEGDDRGGNGWMASPTWWTWVWASCRNWWRTGKPGMLQSIELQRVGHAWVTELQYCLNAAFQLSNFKKNTVPYPKEVFFSVCISKPKLNNLVLVMSLNVALVLCWSLFWKLRSKWQCNSKSCCQY